MKTGRMRRFLKWAAAALGVLLLILWMLPGYVGTRITTSASHRKIKPRNEIAGMPVEQVSITTEDGLVLSAWYVPNGSREAVVTLSGITADRGQMVPTAQTYLNWGFSALLPDLRGTGESQGDTVSIGYYERKDLLACVRWLREQGIEKVGAHGFSLGAATICYAMKETPGLSFAVIESSYDTMQDATEHRLDAVHVPHFIEWPYHFFLSRRLGVAFAALSPMAYLPRCTCPALIMSGDSEGILTPSETENLYEKCGSGRKRLHFFKGGHHAPSISTFPDESRNVLREFLTEDAGFSLP